MPKVPIRFMLPEKFRENPVWAAMADTYENVVLVDQEDTLKRLSKVRNALEIDADYLHKYRIMIGFPADIGNFSEEEARIALDTASGFYVKSGTKRFVDFLSYVKSVELTLIELFSHRDRPALVEAAALFDPAPPAFVVGAVPDGISNWSGTLPFPANRAAVPYLIKVKNSADLTQVAVDDGQGNINGKYLRGTIDYLSGDVDLQFLPPNPAGNVTIEVAHGYRVDVPPISKGTLVITDAGANQITDQAVADPENPGIFLESFGRMSGDTEAATTRPGNFVDYRRGIIAANIASPTLPYTINYATDRYQGFVTTLQTIMAFGDGTTTNFMYNTGTPIAKGLVKVYDTVELFQDDGHGNLIGDQGGTGTVDYVTGDIEVTFATAPAGSFSISLDFLPQDLVVDGGSYYLTNHVYLEIDLDVFPQDDEAIEEIFYQVAPTVLRLKAVQGKVTQQGTVGIAAYMHTTVEEL